MFQSVQLVFLHTISWLYFVNAILLIVHEIESAYWKEWKLFKLKGGLTGFLLIHVPILALILYGLIEVFYQTLIGLLFSIILCLGSIFAFSIHTYFIKKGNEEFTLAISKTVLIAMLVISVVQIILTLIVIFTPITMKCAIC